MGSDVRLSDFKCLPHSFHHWRKRVGLSNPRFHSLHQGSANTLYKGPESKHFRLCGSVCRSSSPLLLSQKRPQMAQKEPAWLGSSPTWFRKVGGRVAAACGPSGAYALSVYSVGMLPPGSQGTRGVPGIQCEGEHEPGCAQAGRPPAMPAGAIVTA